MFFSYFMTMAEWNLDGNDLIGTGDEWLDPNKIVLGRDYDYRRRAVRQAQTAAFLSVIIQQCFAALARKTQTLSIFRDGLKSVFDNKWLNISLLSSLCFAVFLIYTPGVQTFVSSVNLIGYQWLYPLPFGIFLLVQDELRKMCLRRGGYDSACYRYTHY